MAKKLSNQITFTEQKQIKELKEWYLATTLDEGVTWDTKGWTTTTQSVNSTKKYLWSYEEVVYSIGGSEKSDPVLIGMFGTGVDGKGITDVLSYYGISQKSELPDPIPDDFWKKEFSNVESLSSVNKYLWKYKKVLYTDGSYETTNPIVIGVYSDSGEDIITFQIYSLDGFEFKNGIDDEDRLETIKLQLSAFKGNQPLTGCIYTWYWWNPNPTIYTPIEVTAETIGEYWALENEVYVPKTLPKDYGDAIIYYISSTSEEGKYEEILTTGDPFFEVNIKDEYAFANLKCTISYNGASYEDYVMLTNKVDVYNAVVDFFNNTNVLAQTEKYIVGYIELYKDNQSEESVRTKNCYMGNSIVNKDTGIINTDRSRDGVLYDDLSYFICSNGTDDYEIVLGEYTQMADSEYGGEWMVVDNTTKYIYQLDINAIVNSNTFLVLKKNINKNENFSVKVYTAYSTVVDENGNKQEILDADSLVAITRATITDLNDVIISDKDPTEDPTNIVNEGQMWLNPQEDTLWIYTNGSWVSTAKNRGQSTYTVKPNVYKKGDLWIVSKEDEIIGFQKSNQEVLDFVEGSIWIAEKDSDATGFNPEHWSDAVPEITALQNNINYFFDFNKTSGLKISHNSDRFYVNIHSTRMSFCENPDIKIPDEEIQEVEDPNEVVHIGNRSATIHNLVVEGSADINSFISVDNKVNIVNTYEDTKKDSPGFTWQVEADGSFSLVEMMEVE